MGRIRKNWNVVTLNIPKDIPEAEALKRIRLAREVMAHGEPTCVAPGLTSKELLATALDDLVRMKEFYDSLIKNLQETIDGKEQ